ncbi:MAG TPA: 1-deoxy-D-xylulose-5-phosphate reductoisomerase [Actinomycetota bacterium]|nr:1-deoxy-D-xylulose-5-phosphate reductoisomerase [Actinomycetota bacterium]
MTSGTPTNLAILGSTGSIGRQAIDVVLAHPDRWRIVGLAAGSDGAALAEQVAQTGADHSGLGADYALHLATLPEIDLVLNAIVGAAGLRASAAALGAGKTLALANKESLVAGGRICLDAARRGGGSIVPVDSEHAAISQCLEARASESVERIVLTASGGPFRTRRLLDDVSPDEALAHPTWSMGPKISIDSATLMNKGLEVIEAHYLFGLDYDHIDVVVHPQSLVHGVVVFADGSMLLQAAPTDMRIPIQAALSHPDRLPFPVERIDLEKVASLAFEPVDHNRFPCLRLAYEAGRKGGSFPAVLNAANEEAVNAFLLGFISFPSIPTVIESVLEAHAGNDTDDLDVMLDIDAWARSQARRIMRRHTNTRRRPTGIVRDDNRGPILGLPGAPEGGRHRSGI